MRKGSPHPRLLGEVMEAIAKLKELDGSTPKKISNQVEAILYKKRKQLKKDVTHITKALKHGVRTGLITRNKGKYKLGLAKKDYNVFKNLTSIVRNVGVFRQHRRRARRKSKRGRRKSRRGRRRRHSNWEEDSDDNFSEISQDSLSSVGTPIPEDRGRRRRRKGGRKRRRSSRRRGRRGRKHAEEGPNKTETISENKNQPKRLDQKSSNDSVKYIGSNSQFNRNNDEMDQDDEVNNDDAKDNETKDNCDNPECLCNIMPPTENKHDNRKTK